MFRNWWPQKECSMIYKRKRNTESRLVSAIYRKTSRIITKLTQLYVMFVFCQFRHTIQW